MAEITRNEIVAIIDNRCHVYMNRVQGAKGAADAILARLGDGWRPIDDKARSGGLVDLWGHEDIMPPLSALRRIPDCQWVRWGWGASPGDRLYAWKSPSGREIRTAKYYIPPPSPPKESA